SGVYRHGRTTHLDQVVSFYRDGKTASIAVSRVGSTLAIATNGKSDAAIEMNPGGRPTGDEYTMTLAGALPLLMKPEAKTFANIGVGSGLTSETVLSHSGPLVLDTIEIEDAMVAGAQS